MIFGQKAWINKDFSIFSLSFSGLSEKNYFFFLDCQVYNKKEVLGSRENPLKKKKLSASFIWIDKCAQDTLLAATETCFIREVRKIPSQLKC